MPTRIRKKRRGKELEAASASGSTSRLGKAARVISAAGYGVRAGRGVPDVAAQQSPGYYVVMDAVELAMGGTSAVAPMWAAMTARINQHLGAPAGFFAPLLYRAVGGPAFTAVIAGNNGRFKAGPGWNPCTGLGVPNGVEIENSLRGPSA